MHSYGGFLGCRGSNFAPLKFTFNAEHFIRWLSWSISNGYGEIYSYRVSQPEIAEKFATPERSSGVLVMISSKSVSICNRSHVRRANGGKITIYYGVSLFDVLVRGESPHTAARNLLAGN